MYCVYELYKSGVSECCMDLSLQFQQDSAHSAEGQDVSVQHLRVRAAV